MVSLPGRRGVLPLLPWLPIASLMAHVFSSELAPRGLGAVPCPAMKRVFGVALWVHGARDVQHSPSQV